jgi:hypothetical protein
MKWNGFMSRIKQLIKSYKNFISIPWKEDAAAAQRVIFCVYGETEELRLRSKIDEFEIVTRQAEHGWAVYDLTDTFAAWLKTQRYAESYFKKPQLIHTLLPKYLEYIVLEFRKFTEVKGVNENSVVALKGVGSLFGFLKVKEVVDNIAPLVKGRLLIFFPGSYEGNNYRLLDGYDGWNYLAVPITADKE